MFDLNRTIGDLVATAHGMNPASPLTPIQAMMKLQQIDMALKQGKNPKDVAKSTVLDQTLEGIQSALTPKPAQPSQGIAQGMPVPQGAPQGAPQGGPQAGPLQVQAPSQQQANQAQMQAAAQQQAMAQQQAPQQSTMPMAHGGITHVPSNLHFHGGGIIAFSGPTPDNNNSQVKDPNAPAANAPAANAPEVQPYDADAALAQAQQQAQDLINYQPTTNVQSKADILKTMPQWAQSAAAVAPGANYLKDQNDINDLQQKQFLAQREHLQQQQGLPALFKALTQAGQVTGQRGLGSFLGQLGSAIDQGQESQFGQQMALSTAEIKQKSTMADARNTVEELQRATANNDVQGIQKAQAELDKIAKDLQVSKATLVGHLATTAGSVKAAERRAEATENAADINARSRLDAADKTKPLKDQAEGIAIFAKDLKRQHKDDPAWDDDRINAEALRQYQTGKQQGTLVGVIARAHKEAMEALRKEKLARPVNSQPPMTEDEEAAYIEKYMTGAIPALSSVAPSGGGTGGGSNSAQPPGTTLGRHVEGKGQEVLKDGKVIGYMRD